MQILKQIPKGEQNAIHLQELSDLLKVSTTTIKKQIRELRKSGIPILSSVNGYFLAETRSELMEFLRRFNKQSISRFSTTKTIRSEFKNNITGQMHIDDYEKGDQD